ncbi:ABC transporter permease [Sulfolobus sp. B1]|uniref:ABC transporter permease n=1 Tax=Sulfolobus sp. B1 TaxID=2200888 RepID=UPI002107EAEC|nr:ABC transporter permease [Sulfolobus sp. B1]
MRRIINAIITIIMLIVVIFILIHVIAPNPLTLAKIYSGNPHPTYAQLIVIERKYGLNKPLYVQIINYISNLFHGNLGMDPVYKVPVVNLLSKYIPRTLEITIPATVLSVIIGLVTGAIGASNRGKVLDYFVRGVYLVTWSSPTFLIATVLQLGVAYYLKLLPPYGIVNPALTSPSRITGFPLIDSAIAGDWVYFVSVLRHMILPVTSLAVANFGIVTRLSRSSMLVHMNSDYAKLSLVKGLSRRRVVYGVVLRNASIPIVTLIALLFGSSIAGSVAVEDIFQYHGMGWFITNSLLNLDYVGILSTTVIVAVFIIVANLVADILYSVLDPRVRVGG